VERAPGLRLNKERISILLILLFHIVGLTGFFVSSIQPLFLSIVPYHLLLMFAVMCYSHQTFNLKFSVYVITICCFGYSLEWIGVHQHLLFGYYFYGKTLGFKLNDIPLTIGINWFVLTYAMGTVLQRSPIKSTLLKIVLGAVMLTGLDLAIEPIAVRYNYWHWTRTSGYLTAPAGNYIGWLLCSALMLFIFNRFNFAKQNRAGTVLYITQIVFFVLMRWA
jgi:putative membrane protein